MKMCLLRKYAWVPLVALASLCWDAWLAQLPPSPEQVQEMLEFICDKESWNPADFHPLELRDEERTSGGFLVRPYDYRYVNDSGKHGSKVTIDFTCIRGLRGDDGFCSETHVDDDVDEEEP